MDSGSTHNFLYMYKAKKLGCQIRKTCPLNVFVAGGSKLISQYMVKDFQWKIQGVLFTTDELKMEFMFQGKKAVLRGTDQSELTWMSGKSFSKQCGDDHELSRNMELQALLEEYADVFEEPKTLPLQRSFDHQIPLKEGGRVKYLGHVVTGMRVETDPSKIQAMKDWPVPTNIKQLRGFLGLTGYYRSSQTQTTFEKLKQAMINSPALALLNFDEEFVIKIDASSAGIGHVLQQQGHPIAYLSKTLATTHQSLSSYEKKLLAVSKWLPKLLGFDYEIEYKSGKDNVVSDALSRIERLTELFSLLYSGLSNELMDGLLRKGKWVVGKNETLRTNLIAHFHDSAVGGHSGVYTTTKRLTTFFYWKGLRKMVKQWVDKRRSEKEFKEGDSVYLKLQPYRQLTIRQGRKNKFSAKFLGLIAATLFKLLERKIVKQGNRAVVFGLIQWSNGNEEDATWKILSDIVKRFPEFVLDP
ncbi:transposon ty3-G gag-pol polyprotein [Tanacetum coccineum]